MGQYVCQYVLDESWNGVFSPDLPMPTREVAVKSLNERKQ